MKAFLAVSVAPCAAALLRCPVDAALSCLAGEDTAVERVDEAAGGWIAFAGCDDHDIIGEPGDGFTIRLSRLLSSRVTRAGASRKSRALRVGGVSMTIRS